MRFSLLFVLSAVVRSYAGSQGGDIRGNHGLQHFVTRPDLVAPRMIVAKHHPHAITPGYWFVTPYYVTNQRQRANTKEYVPCQTGAHIFDGNGTLIWSGACKYDNRNIFAFQPVTIDGEQHLSFWLGHQFVGDPEKDIPEEDIPSSAVLMNNQYDEVKRIFQHPFLDCHEVSFQPDGKSVLVTRLIKEVVNDVVVNGKKKPELLHGGFRELDVATQEPIFDWDPRAANVSWRESCDKAGKGSDVGDAWDYFHINSIDKNINGDYLISARHTSTIYKISGTDGHVMWRLGGYQSDFDMEDSLAPHWQHHAKWLFENSTHTILSVFDNAGEDFNRNPEIPQEISAGKIIVLDHSKNPPTAKMLRRFDRPDGQRTPMGGSVYTMGDDPATANVLVNWVIPGYFSEYDSKDRLVFEARFAEEGVKTYRAYKAPFHGRPSEPIAFKLLPIGYAEDDIASTFYVSWNGATEVASWAFYGATVAEGPYHLLQKVNKQGFETSWMMPGRVEYAFAVALDVNDQKIGQSSTQSIQPPKSMDGHYRVMVPLLEESRANHRGELNLSSVSTPEDEEKDSTSMIPARLRSPAAETLPQLIINALALYGFINVGRWLVQKLFRRRKGYSSLTRYSGEYQNGEK